MKIFIAIPALDEFQTLPTCIQSIVNQLDHKNRIFVCVNQPDEWWSDSQKTSICENNSKTIEWIRDLNHSQITLIDRSSKGNGWTGKNHGVGWARKTLMEAIDSEANPEDIIISMDADTTVPANFIQGVVDEFTSNPEIVALANPYYHLLSGDAILDRAMLRYEIYMRNYLINLIRIQSQYSFSALGSAMSFKISAMRSIGGFTPKMSGEDFYFLQKLRKFGKIGIHNEAVVFPATRYSNRVYFGTGPALIKGAEGDWSSYPIYHYSLFDQIEKTILSFPELFHQDLKTPMDDFLKEIFKEENIWAPLRQNYPNQQQFIRACNAKVDALRILQFLKQSQEKINLSDEECLRDNLANIFGYFLPESFSFTESPIGIIDSIRESFFEVEMSERSKHKKTF